jgi:hypothetical protein
MVLNVKNLKLKKKAVGAQAQAVGCLPSADC